MTMLMPLYDDTCTLHVFILHLLNTSKTILLS